MFRHIFNLPYRQIKIPWQMEICFEEVPGAVVDLAVQAGETAAKVETVQETQEVQAEQLETQENRLKWTQEDVDNLWRRMNDLEDRVAALEATPIIDEVAEETPEETPPAEETPTETIIDEPEQTKTKKQVKKWTLL